jgi:hypothetical protein
MKEMTLSVKTMTIHLQVVRVVNLNVFVLKMTSEQPDNTT